MVKKRSPREVIESTQNPDMEESWLKFPNEELQVNSLKREIGLVNRDQIGSAQKAKDRYASGYREYRGTGIHTHPYRPHRLDDDFHRRYSQLPSPEDLKNLLASTHHKTEIIAQTDSKTGVVLGYTILRKTKQTPHWEFTKVSKLENPIKKVLFNLGLYMPDENKTGESDYAILEYKHSGVKTGLYGDLRYLVDGFKKFADKTHLQYKFIRVKKSNAENSSGSTGLEKIAATTTLVSLLSGAFFFSTKITGNFVGVSTQTSSLIGVGLIIIGLVSGLFYFRSKNK